MSSALKEVAMSDQSESPAPKKRKREKKHSKTTLSNRQVVVLPVHLRWKISQVAKEIGMRRAALYRVLVVKGLEAMGYSTVGVHQEFLRWYADNIGTKEAAEYGGKGLNLFSIPPEFPDGDEEAQEEG